jgi:hypothetical protein
MIAIKNMEKVRNIEVILDTFNVVGIYPARYIAQKLVKIMYISIYFSDILTMKDLLKHFEVSRIHKFSPRICHYVTSLEMDKQLKS